MLTLLLIMLMIGALFSIPAWPHSRGWGYYPSGGLGLIAVVLIVFLLFHA